MVENYVESVIQKKQCDQVFLFQLYNGFEVIGIFFEYFNVDYQFMGYVVYLMWCNLKVLVEDFNNNKKKYGGRVLDFICIGIV